MPTKGCIHDQGTGDLPVQINNEETLWILSKNPRSLCFEEGFDHKITAGIKNFMTSKRQQGQLKKPTQTGHYTRNQENKYETNYLKIGSTAVQSRW